MAGALIGALRVTLGIDTAAFENGLSNAERKISGAGAKLESIGGKMTGMGAKLSVAVTAPLVAFGVAASKAATESAQAMGQVNSALASMGPVAGRTADQLQEQAAALQHISTFDDDDILRNVTSNLLTFGKISGDVFDRAQLAAVNLSARLGQDLQSSTIQLGKALNDPIKGVTALQRVGVSFTAAQKEQIKAMVEAGDTAGAQRLILHELEGEFGGAAKAMRDASPGADTVDAWRNFQETIGGIINAALPPLTNMLTGLLNAFNNLDPGTQSFLVGLAAAAAAIGPLLVMIGSVVSAVGTISGALAPVIGLIGEAGLGAALGTAAAAAAPFIAAGAALAAAWMLFGDKVGPVLSALWEKLQAVLGPKVQALFEVVKTSLTELWEGPFGQAIRVVIGVLGDLLAAVTAILGEAIIRYVSALVDGITSAFKIIGDIFKVFAALLRGDFAGAWNAVKTLVSDVVSGWLKVLEDLAPGAINAVKALYNGVKEWIGDKLGALWEWLKGKIQSVADKFKWLWDVVVGHSYIPDLFDGIQTEANRFGPEFVDPLLGGIGQVSKAFAGIQVPALDVPTPGLPSPANDNPPAGDGAPAGDGTVPTDDARAKLKDAFKETFSDGIKAALDGHLGDFLRNKLKDIGAHALDGLLDKLGDALFNAIGGLFSGGAGGGGGIGGLLGTVFSGLFGGGGGGFRAGGGPVLANHPYVVGEKRPELFIPSTSGRIDPHVTSAPARGTNDSGLPRAGVTINFHGPVSNPEQVRRSAAQAGAALGRIVAAGQRGS